MTITASNTTSFLRGALTFDGVVTTASGVALAPLAWTLAGPLGLPAAALLAAGVFFACYGLAVLYLGTRPVTDRRGAWAVVAANSVSALACVAVAVLAGATTLGAVVLVALGVAIAGLAALQVLGLRRR
ncbi:hypothetical protein BLA60_25320 [Actinophytocola xinjiangensis]|uniref:Integral membrane protein n=1 Tax=Actinophytocola xinjiangensis TaxID=485602 RepID=A0A7Z1AWR7_9PSEU|nr:hypothetical protein [Actinophytocola xinjiangensis]OLF08177.1 hypothetical protein BLA60_25320 [Actinophytocola xinjiangensis]